MIVTLSEKTGGMEVKMKITIKVIILIVLIINLIIGCTSNEKYKIILEAEGESKNWSIVFNSLDRGIVEDNTLFHFVLSYKNDPKDLMSLEKIEAGFIWLNKDSELITTSWPDLILNYNYQAARESIVYKGSSEQPVRLFSMLKSEPLISEDPKHNKEFTYSFVMINEELENIAPEIYFVVAWGDKIETIRVLKTF